jgi:hypothetical protein
MNILKCKVIYEIIFVLFRTLRLLGIKTCEPTEELGGRLYAEYIVFNHALWGS